MPVSIAVTIVTYDSAAFLARCLDAVAAQTHAPREVVVLDNRSRDDSAAIARAHGAVTKLIESRTTPASPADRTAPSRRPAPTGC